MSKKSRQTIVLTDKEKMEAFKGLDENLNTLPDTFIVSTRIAKYLLGCGLAQNHNIVDKLLRDGSLTSLPRLLREDQRFTVESLKKIRPLVEQELKKRTQKQTIEITIPLSVEQRLTFLEQRQVVIENALVQRIFALEKFAELANARLNEHKDRIEKNELKIEGTLKCNEPRNKSLVR